MEETGNSNNGNNNNNTVSGGSSSPQEEPKILPIGSVVLLPPPPPPPLPQTTSGSSSRGESYDWSGKKKRGRPRKYDADGKLSPAYIISSQAAARTIEQIDSKKGRGATAQMLGLGVGGYQLPFPANPGGGGFLSTGGEIIPHVLRANTGEDIVQKILSFTQMTPPRGVSILSASGPVSNVTLRQPGSLGGMLTYEGQFEILSLSGSFPQPDPIRSQTGPLSISLAGSDGQVIGGVLTGVLKAAAPLQIILGSFTLNVYRTLKRKLSQYERTVAPLTGSETAIRATPISQAKVVGENLIRMPLLPADQIQRESGSASTERENLDATPGAAATGNGSEEYSDATPDINNPLPDE